MTASLHFLTSDLRLLDRIRRGDEGGLVALFESNRRSIRSLISRNSGNADDADDVLQESLIVLWERVRSGQFDQTAKLSTFLYATARNIWLTRLRQKGREIHREIDPENYSDDSLSPLEELVATEQVSMIQEALGNIGEQCRKLLLLFYWEELTMEEIADRLGFANADTAKAKKYQCKKALEKALGVLHRK
jgi:RNA polymerase sigma factor (sigma-70 family)